MKLHKNFASFCSLTGIHGFAYIVDGNWVTTAQSVFWIAIGANTLKRLCLSLMFLSPVLTGIVWSSVNVASVFRGWQATPVKSVIVDHYYDASQIPFPVITLQSSQVKGLTRTHSQAS